MTCYSVYREIYVSHREIEVKTVSLTTKWWDLRGLHHLWDSQDFALRMNWNDEIMHNHKGVLLCMYTWQSTPSRLSNRNLTLRPLLCSKLHTSAQRPATFSITRELWGKTQSEIEEEKGIPEPPTEVLNLADTVAHTHLTISKLQESTGCKTKHKGYSSPCLRSLKTHWCRIHRNKEFCPVFFCASLSYM